MRMPSSGVRNDLTAEKMVLCWVLEVKKERYEKTSSESGLKGN